MLNPPNEYVVDRFGQLPQVSAPPAFADSIMAWLLSKVHSLFCFLFFLFVIFANQSESMNQKANF